MTEPAGWVRQFADDIAAHPDPTYVAKLLAQFEAATAHEVVRLRRVTAYRLRMAGYGAQGTADLMHVDRSASSGWARTYARSNGLPWPPPREMFPHADDVLQT